MIMNTKKLISLLSIIGMLFLMSACDDDNGPDNSNNNGEANFLHSVIIGKQSYISLFKDLDVGSTTTDNAITHTNYATLYPHNNDVYVSEILENKVYKYSKNGNDLRLDGVLAFGAFSMPNCVTILNDDKGYISLRGTGKVAVFNPTTMTLIKEIDLSAYAITAPDSSKDYSPEPASSVIRNDMLYVCLLQEKAPFDPNPSAYMALIDTKADTAIKMISDARANMAGSADASEDIILDENGDIYVYCTAGYGRFNSLDDGFLRIKNGESEFDPSYHFSIKSQTIPDVNGNMADYIYQKVYMGNGLIYCYLNIPADASFPEPDYVNDKTAQPARINIYTKNIEILDLEATPNWSACLDQTDNYVIFGMAGLEGPGYYFYDLPSDSSMGKKISTQGAPFRFFEF